MNSPIRIVGIAGSLRRDSFNRAALRAAQQLVPEDATLETVDLKGIPPFSEDDEKRHETEVQKVTDKAVGEIDQALVVKEMEIMQV